MGLGVGGVVKLVGHPGGGVGLQQLLGLGNGTAHALSALREHQLRPQGGQQGAALLAHGLRHGEHHTIAPLAADIGQGHAGIAAGGLHDGGTRLQQAGLLSGPDHIQSRTVLGGGQGIKALQLAQDTAAGGKALQTKQGGIANQFRNGMGDFHGRLPPIIFLRLLSAYHTNPTNSIGILDNKQGPPDGGPCFDAGKIRTWGQRRPRRSHP